MRFSKLSIYFVGIKPSKTLPGENVKIVNIFGATLNSNSVTFLQDRIKKTEIQNVTALFIYLKNTGSSQSLVTFTLNSCLPQSVCFIVISHLKLHQN